MVRKQSNMLLDEEFELLTGSEWKIIDDLFYPTSEIYAGKLLDRVETALKRARIRLEKQVAKQHRWEQKLKGGK